MSAATVKKRDPNLDNEAVMKYREIVRLQANYLQRECIAETVENSARGLRIWEATLIEYMLHGRNPKDVLAMLKSYQLMSNGK
jgi:hypothetical protein